LYLVGRPIALAILPGESDRDLAYNLLFVALTVFMLWWRGAEPEIRSYLVGVLWPPLHKLPAMAALLFVVMLAVIALTWLKLANCSSLTTDYLLRKVFAASILEEVIFRGIILTILLQFVSAPRWAVILLSAAIFTSVHPLDAWRVLYVITAGVVFSYAFVLTRSVPFCVCCHALWNLSSTCPFLTHESLIRG
jgi:membrane protease YdiL (CAAX protease family)